MKIMLRVPLIPLFIILINASLSVAADHYIRAGATGSNNGNDWTNAWVDLPNTFVRGDTYYVADGIYGGHTFETPDRSNQYIFIKKATTLYHGTDIGWNSSYGDGVATFFNSSLYFSSSYWDFDGVVGSGKSGHGFKIYNNSTTSGMKLINFLSGSGRHYINFRRIEIEHAGATIEYDGLSHDAVYINTGYQNTHLLWQYCYIHNIGRCPFLWRNVDDSIIEYCVIEYTDNGGPPANCTAGTEHSEPISALDSDRNIIRYNTWGHYCGTCALCLNGTDNEVYANVFYDGYHSNGTVSGWTAHPSANTKVYNNTVVDIAQSSRMGVANDSGFLTYNNVFYNCAGVGFSGSHDYNAFSGSSTYSESHAQSGITSSIFVNYNANDFRLSTSSETGQPLSLPYNQDMNGAIRGTDGIWDRGAFEYIGSNQSSPDPPTGLRIITP